MDNLRPATKLILERVEKLSGRPVQFFRDESLPVLATIQMARHGAPFHVLRYKPSNDPLDYFVAYQAGFILRLFENPPSERYDFVAAEAGRPALETLLAAGQKLNPTEQQALPHFVTVIFNWAMVNLRSLPIGMRIDHWIATACPELKDLVVSGIALQQQLNANVLSQRIGKLMVPSHLLAANAAYALFADRLTNTQTFSIPYGAAGVLQEGSGLLQLWDDIPNSPSHDRQLVDRWAAALGMSGWYKWIPYKS